MSVRPVTQAARAQASNLLQEGITGDNVKDDPEADPFANDFADQELTEKDAEGQSTFAETTLGGMLSSRLACKSCGHASITLERFLDLSLPIPYALPATDTLPAA